jgi:hypothetical protein
MFSKSFTKCFISCTRNLKVGSCNSIQTKLCKRFNFNSHGMIFTNRQNSILQGNAYVTTPKQFTTNKLLKLSTISSRFNSTKRNCLYNIYLFGVILSFVISTLIIIIDRTIIHVFDAEQCCFMVPILCILWPVWALCINGLIFYIWCFKLNELLHKKD